MLYELVPFRSFEQDEVYSCFTSILESFGSFDDADRADSAEWFSNSAAQLACYAERAGIGGNVWTAWLAKLFAEAENPFSLAHERRDASGGTMDGLAMQDMEQLYFYLKYDYAKLEKRMNVNMLRRFGKDFKPSACGAPSLERTAGAVIAELAASMEKAASPAELYKAVTDFYHAHGAGRFALYNGFRWDDKAREIVPAAPLEDITFDKLFGYEEQKRALIDNTVAFLEGRPANNVLLYGEGGTGKSSSIKALLNEYAPRGLGMIELYKHQMADFEAVLDAARAWDFADPERIYLMGASQGGFVSAACAARRAGELAGLILLYPGLTIRQVMRRRFGSLANVPDTFELNDWITLGRPYVEAVWDYDIDADIRAYTGPALIIQGSEDPVVSGRDVRRAAGLYRNAELHVIPGAGHGFEGRDVSEAVGYIGSFIDRTGRENRAAV